MIFVLFVRLSKFILIVKLQIKDGSEIADGPEMEARSETQAG